MKFKILVQLNLIIIFSLIFTASGFAQAPDVLWTKTFGGTEYEQGYAVRPTSDGGFIIISEVYSNTYSNTIGTSVWLIRTDSLGNVLWTKSIGFNQIERAFDVKETFNNEFILSGYTNSIGAGSYDVLLIRTNSIGDTLWTKTFGTAGYESGNQFINTLTAEVL